MPPKGVQKYSKPQEWALCRELSVCCFISDLALMVDASLNPKRSGVCACVCVWERDVCGLWHKHSKCSHTPEWRLAIITTKFFQSEKVIWFCKSIPSLQWLYKYHTAPQIAGSLSHLSFVFTAPIVRGPRCHGNYLLLPETTCCGNDTPHAGCWQSSQNCFYMTVHLHEKQVVWKNQMCSMYFEVRPDLQ